MCFLALCVIILKRGDDMRIIAGHNRGRKLKAVPGMKTRPTADRVKEAVFSSIHDDLFDAKFLDVFSGTGSISLEALSRGAAEAVLLEKDEDALKVIRENIRLCGQENKCQVLKGDSLASLDRLAGQGKQFDYIYIDPPYQAELYEKVLAKIEKGNLLRLGGTILVESAKNTSFFPQNSIFFICKEKNYGDTKISYIQHKEVLEEDKQ